MRIAIRILQTQMTVVLGIFDYSTICLIDKLISAQCCLSYRNQSFDFIANQMSCFYIKNNTGLKRVKWEKRRRAAYQKLLGNNREIVTTQLAFTCSKSACFYKKV